MSYTERDIVDMLRRIEYLLQEMNERLTRIADELRKQNEKENTGRT